MQKKIKLKGVYTMAQEKKTERPSVSREVRLASE